ncbi:MAG: hypothetical protein AAFO07_11945, partial [Bacteroidota bacterium]
MKDEEKYLKSLFEEAQQDSTGPSFEEVSQRFEASLSGLGFWGSFKKWILNHPTINIIVMMNLVLLSSLAIWIGFSPKQAKEAILPVPIETVDAPPAITESISPDDIPKATQKIELEHSIEELQIEEAIFEKIEKLLELHERPVEPLTLPSSTLPLLSESWNKEKSDVADITSDTILPIKRENINWPESAFTEETRGYGTTINTDVQTWKDWNRSFKKEIAFVTTGTTFIKNEFGEVAINTWSKDSVKIEAIVQVKAHNQKTGQQVFDNVEVAFSESSKEVKAQTVVRNKKKIGWYKRKNWSVKIHYTVYIPQNSNVYVQNKYGNVQVQELKGQSDINLKFGDIKIEKTGNARISLSNGEATIKEGAYLDSKLHFAKLYADKLGAVNLDLNNSYFETEIGKEVKGKSSWSELKLGVIEDYTLNGNGNKSIIHRAHNIKLSGSNAKINLVEANDLDLELKFS